MSRTREVSKIIEAIENFDAVSYSATTPSNPEEGELWIDINPDTPVLKAYNGSAWEVIGSINQVSEANKPQSTSIGSLIYNTTNNTFEAYTAQGWYKFFGQAPYIDSVEVTSGATSANRLDPNVQAQITISGGNFDNPTVTLNTFIVPSSNVSNTSGQILVTTGQNVIPSDTYTTVFIENEDGQTASASCAIVVNAAPVWGALTTYSGEYAAALTINNGFTDEEDNPVTYSLQSGSLPTGFSLNEETGVLSGTYNAVYTNAPSILYSPTIRATDSIGNYEDAQLNITITVPFLYRQIINYAYTAGGYKDSSPWRNVNKIPVATDTSASLGDLLQYAAAYTSGAHNRDKAFQWGGGGMGNYSSTSVFNMRTDSTANRTSAMDTPVTVGDAATVQHDETQKAWIANGLGSSVIQRFDLATETATTNFALAHLQNDGTGAGGAWTETTGYFYGDSTSMRLTFATETPYAGIRVGVHGQQKAMPTKINVAYGGNEGTYNGGYNLRKWNLVTDTQTSTISKPIGNSGEENMTMGQSHQYMLGMYDGAQNNRAWRFNYNTDSGYEGSSAMQPKGVTGRSSGHCYWRD